MDRSTYLPTGLPADRPIWRRTERPTDLIDSSANQGYSDDGFRLPTPSAQEDRSQLMRVLHDSRCRTVHSRHASASHSLHENIRLPFGQDLPHQLHSTPSAAASHDPSPWCPAQLKLCSSRPGPGTQN